MCVLLRKMENQYLVLINHTYYYTIGTFLRLFQKVLEMIYETYTVWKRNEKKIKTNCQSFLRPLALQRNSESPSVLVSFLRLSSATRNFIHNTLDLTSPNIYKSKCKMHSRFLVITKSYQCNCHHKTNEILKHIN